MHSGWSNVFVIHIGIHSKDRLNWNYIFFILNETEIFLVIETILLRVCLCYNYYLQWLKTFGWKRLVWENSMSSFIPIKNIIKASLMLFHPFGIDKAQYIPFSRISFCGRYVFYTRIKYILSIESPFHFHPIL